jgi:hypothetical protein
MYVIHRVCTGRDDHLLLAKAMSSSMITLQTVYATAVTAHHVLLLLLP